MAPSSGLLVSGSARGSQVLNTLQTLEPDWPRPVARPPAACFTISAPVFIWRLCSTG